METKICTQCKKDLSLDKFGKDNRNKSGLKSECKNCQHKRNEQYRKDNPKKIADNKRKYVKNNIEKVKEQHDKYVEDNREKITEYSKKYNKIYRTKNKITISEQTKIYYESNIDKIKESNRKWKLNNSDKISIIRQNRRARMSLLPSNFTLEDWNYCKTYFDNKCCYCGEELSLAQEHFVPVTKGGAYIKENIICACRSCNSSKSNKDFSEWYPTYKYYSKERENKILNFLKSVSQIDNILIKED